MNFKEFDYEFDLNGYYVLKKLISKKIVNKINYKLTKIENLKFNELPHNVFFGKKKNNKDAYISNILEIGKEFEDLALNPVILKIMKRVTLGMFRLNHAVSMTKYKKKTFTPLHMGNLPMHPKIFYMIKNGKIFSNVTKVVFPICNNKKIDGGFAVIPGSHKSNFIRPQNSDPKNNYKLLKYIDASPGDAIIFTESLAHGSLVNYSNNIRRILSYCYSVGYMPDWTKFNLSYSEKYKKEASKKIKKLIKLTKD